MKARMTRSRSVARFTEHVQASRVLNLLSRPLLTQVSNDQLGVIAKDIVTVSHPDATRPLAPLRRAIFSLSMVTPEYKFKPRWRDIRMEWCERLHKLYEPREVVTEEDFVEIHALLVMLQSSIKLSEIAPWFDEVCWRERMQHASDVSAFADIVVCLWSAIVGGQGPQWMVA